jgi:hypothetical protein
MLSAGLLDKDPRSVPSCSSHQAIRKADLSVKTLYTLIWGSTLLLAAFGSAGCSARTAGSAELQSLTPASAAALDESARTFMHTVAHDVTQEGPLAWLKFFNTGPEFFMAVNGQLAFPNAAAAKEGTQNFARTINHIDLTWGDDLYHRRPRVSSSQFKSVAQRQFPDDGLTGRNASGLADCSQ